MLKHKLARLTTNRLVAKSSDVHREDKRLKTHFHTKSGFRRRQIEGRVSAQLKHALSCMRAEVSTVTAFCNLKSSNGSDFQRILFLDTETTGLGFGASTYAFLVGLTYVDDESCVTEQLFMTSPAEEVELLTYLRERLDWADTIVSYNGQSYDVPLIQARMRMHGLNCDLNHVHLDLYRITRTILKRRLARRRLVDIERGLFDIERIDDIPGCAIPAAYYAFLHRHESDDLWRVIEHNLQDVLTMLELLVWFIEGFLANSSFQDARDELGCIDKAIGRGMREWARSRVVSLMARLQPGSLRGEAALVQYELMRRDNLDHALRVLIQAVGPTQGLLRSTLSRRLAIHFEHDLKDFITALDYAQDTACAEGQAAHRRRLHRLQRKEMKRLG